MSEAVPSTQPASESCATTKTTVLSALAPILVVAIFLGAFAFKIGWPAWPVNDAGDRVVYSAMAIAVIAVIVDLLRQCGKSRCVLVFIASAIAVLVAVVPTMWPMVRPEGWSYAVLVLWSAVAAIVGGASATLAHCLHARRPLDRPLVPLVLAGMAASAGGILQATGSLKLGEASFCLAVAACVLFVLGLFVRAIGASGGVAIAVVACVSSLLVSGHLWSELPLWCAFAVLTAPLLAWIVAISMLARRKRWLRVIVALIIAAIPATVAVGVTAVKANNELKSESPEEAMW